MVSLSPKVRTAGAVALGLLLGTLPAPGRQEPSSEETFSEAIEVSVVSLDVFVTDKKGKPLTGLTKEDFEIYEDGKPVEITNFYAESRPEASPPGEAAGRPEDQKLHLVVFVDDVNMEPQGRARILRDLPGFLDRSLSPGDKVMLVRFNQALEIRRSFTTDYGQIRTDIAALEELSSDAKKYEQSRAHALEDIVNAIEVHGGWGPPAESRIQSWAEQEGLMVKGSLAALDAVVGWLAGVRGRKAILYVSDGLPLVPGDDLYYWASIRSGYRAGQRISGLGTISNDLSERFREVTARASRNRVAFYPIEAYGVRTVRGTALQEATVTSRQNGLRFLADDTGGRAMLNAADPVAALNLMSEDLAAYYSLGYQPRREGDDREHKVEVKVKVKGARVRHRQWYKDKSLGESVAERALAVMRFGPEDNPLEAKLEIGEQKPGEGGVLVPVRVRVPISKLYLTPKEGSRTGSLRLFVVASGAGVVTPVRETEVVSVNIPEAEAEAAAGKARDYVHDVGITLKPGSYAVGVAVRDEAGAVTSYLRKEFEVGTGGAKAPITP
jgi:VWFA-related protein